MNRIEEQARYYRNIPLRNRSIKAVVHLERTNKWLAEQLGCAPTTVSKWCTNVSQPPMETFKGGRALEIPSCNNVELINYIKSVF